MLTLPMGGNADGRSMGERLAIDPNQPTPFTLDRVASAYGVDADSASTWSQVTSFPVIGGK